MAKMENLNGTPRREPQWNKREIIMWNQPMCRTQYKSMLVEIAGNFQARQNVDPNQPINQSITVFPDRHKK